MLIHRHDFMWIAKVEKSREYELNEQVLDAEWLQTWKHERWKTQRI